MAYRIVDVEVSDLSPIELGDAETGLAVVVRSRGRPVSFFLEDGVDRRTLSAEDVGLLVGRRVAGDVVRDAVWRELDPPAPATAVEITVAVCTRDRPELLVHCLEGLRALHAPGCRVELLVIDNAPSTGATRAVVEAVPGVRYTVEPLPGLDFARNRALEETRTPYIAYLDDDAVVDAGWLDALCAAWRRYPDAAAVTGMVLPFELRTPAQVAFEVRGGFRRGTGRARYASGNAYRRTHPLGAGRFGTGANMAFRTDVLRELGGFDDALDTGPPLPGGGDLDIFYRVLRGGHTLVYEPAAAVFHRHRTDMPALRRQYWTWGTGYLAFLHKTARRDPAVRVQAGRMVAWWLLHHAAAFVRSAAGRGPHRWTEAQSHALELAGGIATGAWKYPASRRRAARLRRER